METIQLPAEWSWQQGDCIRQQKYVTRSTVVESKPSRSVLEVLHGLLRADSAGTVDEPGVLLELARTLGVWGVGWASLGSPRVRHRVRIEGHPAPATLLPWEEQPHLLAQLRESPKAIPARSSTGESWLLARAVTPSQECLVLWLEASANRSWDLGEAASLQLAAQALATLVAPGLLAEADAGARRLQQRLQDAGVLASRMAHAFDNVLTGILGFAELTLTQMPPGSTSYRYVAEVLEAAQQGTQFTQKLHLFGRAGTPRPGLTALAAIIGDEAARLRSVLPPTLQFQVDVPLDLPPVALDPEALRQVLLPLLENSREAVPANGRLGISARTAILTAADASTLIGSLPAGEYVHLQIIDSGSGLSPEVQQRLFVDPFFTAKPRHRGLGLAIVARILMANQGSLRLESPPQGGTIVHVYLPVARAKGPAPIGSVSVAMHH